MFRSNLKWGLGTYFSDKHSSASSARSLQHLHLQLNTARSESIIAQLITAQPLQLNHITAQPLQLNLITAQPLEHRPSPKYVT